MMIRWFHTLHDSHLRTLRNSATPGPSHPDTKVRYTGDDDTPQKPRDSARPALLTAVLTEPAASGGSPPPHNHHRNAAKGQRESGCDWARRARRARRECRTRRTRRCSADARQTQAWSAEDAAAAECSPAGGAKACSKFWRRSAHHDADAVDRQGAPSAPSAPSLPSASGQEGGERGSTHPVALAAPAPCAVPRSPPSYPPSLRLRAPGTTTRTSPPRSTPS